MDGLNQDGTLTRTVYRAHGLYPGDPTGERHVAVPPLGLATKRVFG
jgi:hypothetical protein